jgi:hypothetical protein
MRVEMIFCEEDARHAGALVHHDIADAERDSHMRGGALLFGRLATLGIASLRD